MKVVVSGGSRGLGHEICKTLLENDHTVATFARSTTKQCVAFAEAYGARFLFEELDGTDFETVNNWVRNVDQTWEGIDALINNAAIGQDSLLVHTSADEIARIVTTNLTAPVVLTRAIARTMLRRGIHGQVLMISSICATEGYAGLTAYSSTKGGLDSFARSFAHEMKGRVRINTISPGFFESEMSSVLLPEQLDVIKRRTPSGQLSTPEDVAKIVLFALTSDANLNAAVIPVDGGASS